MDKYEISKRIENFAPLETAEPWDCSGWGVDNAVKDVSKIMLCLTVTEDVVNQARKQNCEMIVSHHPLFYVPIAWENINIYSAHTNLDKANGGTTDTIIKVLGLDKYMIHIEHDFLRIIEFKEGVSVKEFSQIISIKFPYARLVNNRHETILNRIAFCAGSGSEFISEAKILGADCMVTGDLKFHTALDSEIVVYDIGHFDSEILVLPVLQSLIGKDMEIIFAKENSPFSPVC